MKQISLELWQRHVRQRLKPRENERPPDAYAGNLRTGEGRQIWREITAAGEPNATRAPNPIRNCLRSQWVPTDPLAQLCTGPPNNSTFWWIASKNTPFTCSIRTETL